MEHKTALESKRDLCESLEMLALLMQDISDEMHYYGGFDPEALKHSVELSNASQQVLEWAETLSGKTGAVINFGNAA